MKFSIIIPLEYHRDMAEKCLRAWAQEQTFPREDFELILSIPPKFDESDIARLTEFLAPHDRWIRLPYDHDMPLVSQAAHEACGDVLVFTEAHCQPEADFLEQAITVFNEHDEWAGFSCRSIPLTHNLLSEIEAEMYTADIQRNMQQHPWLKVLDQCLVIRRDAYWAAGGVEAEFTHFAEWVFAARLYRQGYQMGYDERPAVHHLYIGDLSALEEFTLDFVTGQMRFAQLANQDPCGDLFEEVAEWSQRQSWNSQIATRMTRLLLADWRQSFWGKPGSVLSGPKQLIRWPWRTAAEWWLRRILALPVVMKLVRMRSIGQRIVVQWHLWRGNKPQAKAAFLRLMAIWAQLGRLNYLSRLPKNYLEDECSKSLPYSEWLPVTRQTLPSVGMHNFELLDQVGFRWSKPAAMVWLPPLKGDWRVTMEWAEAAPFWSRQGARFYLNENHISLERVTHHGNLTEFVVTGDGASALRLSWVCEAFESAEDTRNISLPLVRITWAEAETQAALPPASLVTLDNETLYFLHVRKCAGTTTRLVLANAFASNEMLKPYNVAFYYARQLKNQPELHAPYALAIGHFGWELITQVNQRQPRQWRVVTLLRDPLERLLSQFDFLKQHDRLSSQQDFSDWVTSKLYAQDLQLLDFVPHLVGWPMRGIQSLQRTLSQHLPTALVNLRSCEVVGLQERLDDSLNLLGAATNCLLPRRVSRVNVTLNRTPRAALDTQALSLLAESLGAEREFYAAAQVLFEQQLARLHQRLAEEAGRELDTQGVREVLRQRYFDRRSQECLQQGLPPEIRWSPDSDFPGYNLYDREQHADQTLRWTGPEAETTFYYPLVAATQTHVEIYLHGASPSQHVEGAQLFVNEIKIPLSVECTSEGYLLTATFDTGPPPSDCGIFSEFTLVTPTQRGTNEFRELGVALQSIHLERHEVVALSMGAYAD